MDPYIKAKLEKAGQYFNAALDRAKQAGREEERDAGIILGVAEVKKIEKYIKKMSNDQKENEKYITLIK